MSNDQTALAVKLTRAAADPGQFVGYKGDRSLSQWMYDAIAAVLVSEALAVRPEWKPIETAPRDGARVLLGFQFMTGFSVVAHSFGDDWLLTGDGMSECKRCGHDGRLHGRPNPTHWMPLPAAPGLGERSPQ